MPDNDKTSSVIPFNKKRVAKMKGDNKEKISNEEIITKKILNITSMEDEVSHDVTIFIDDKKYIDLLKEAEFTEDQIEAIFREKRFFMDVCKIIADNYTNNNEDANRIAICFSSSKIADEDLHG